MTPPDTPELEAAFNLLREIYWREYGRGWREAIAKIRNIAADPGGYRALGDRPEAAPHPIQREGETS